MPAAKQDTRRIRAVSAGMLNDTGISSAIAIGGDRPGIAPMTSPMTTPRIIAVKFSGDTTLARYRKVSSANMAHDASRGPGAGDRALTAAPPSAAVPGGRR